MPRPKTIERRRCLVACDICKKRKLKCDSLLPCSKCKKRNRAQDCTYLAFQRPGRRRQEGVLAIEPSPSPSNENSPESFPPEANDTFPSNSAPVPKLSRMLKDTSGKLIYIGDSASVSYLETIRRIVDTSVGPCSFTSDKLRHQLIESNAIVPESGIPKGEPTPDLASLLELTQQFFNAASGVLDLFDASIIAEQLPAWVQDPMRSQWPDCALFYLVFAIGAQVRASGNLDDQIAERYFILGRHHVTRNFVDDPSLVMVQAFCLITWYMLTACRRNGALMNLGIAIQAAYALGIHRHEANLMFEDQVSASRERVWKSLRVCDLFLSASMGRPSMTSNVDCNIQFSAVTSSDDEESLQKRNRLSSAITRLCLIFERVLSEVYSKQVVSLELAVNISKQHREWTEELPQMLRFDGLAGSDYSNTGDLAGVLGPAVIVMGYYYSIILLTRPFLTFCVNSSIKDPKYWLRQTTQDLDVTTYASACIDAATKTMEVVQSVLFLDGMPKRMPVLINSVFISALTLGLAYFADYDRRGWDLDNPFTQAVAVLESCGLHNPQAARYKQIIEYLRAATSQYRSQRDASMLILRNQQLRNVFGNISTEIEPRGSSILRLANSSRTPDLPTPSSTLRSGSEVAFASSASSALPEYELMLPTSLITTSGVLAHQPRNRSDNQDSQYLDVGEDINSFNFSNTPAPDQFSFEVFGDYGPIFSIMNDYGQQEESNY